VQDRAAGPQLGRRSVAARVTRRHFLGAAVRHSRGCAALGALSLSGSCFLPSARAPRPYRIGWLAFGPASSEQAANYQTYLEELRTFGYVEGENLIVERRVALPDEPARLRELATELASLPADVIVAVGNPVISEVKRTTSAIPIVMAAATSDPVETGLIDSLARPGGNVTGLTTAAATPLGGKWLELLLQAAPGKVPIAVLRDLLVPGSEMDWLSIQEGARQLGAELILSEARTRDEIERAVRAASRERAQALVVLPAPAFFRNRGLLVELVNQQGLPSIYPVRDFAEIGGLLSYGPRLLGIYRRAAYYTDRLLRGTAPQDLPVERPRQFELVINLRTANALGLTFSRQMLSLADDVIR
jgi:putative tryptophan/tyrosine transport system substrate-binding protein